MAGLCHARQPPDQLQQGRPGQGVGPRDSALLSNSDRVQGRGVVAGYRPKRKETGHG